MTVDAVPVLVFSGHYTEAVFLKTLLESAGIETSLQGAHVSRGALPACGLLVRAADVEAARELIEDFERNGQRTES